jgi:invasion protein IalB
MLFQKSIVNILSAALILSFSSAVLAKTSAKDTKKTSAKEKVFDDWRVSCSKDKSSKKEVCIALQSITTEKDKKQIQIATYQFVKEKKDHRIVYVLPQSLLIQPGVAIIAGDKVLTKANFTICNNGVCVASGLVPSNDLKQILSQEAVSVAVFDSEGNQQNITMSTKGLKKALDSVK